MEIYVVKNRNEKKCERRAGFIEWTQKAIKRWRKSSSGAVWHRVVVKYFKWSAKIWINAALSGLIKTVKQKNYERIIWLFDSNIEKLSKRTKQFHEKVMKRSIQNILLLIFNEIEVLNLKISMTQSAWLLKPLKKCVHSCFPLHWSFSKHLKRFRLTRIKLWNDVPLLTSHKNT